MSSDYQPPHPEVRIALADRGDDLAGVLRLDMSRDQFDEYLGEVEEGLESGDTRYVGSPLLIEFREPFEDLEIALNELRSRREMVLVPVDHGDVDTRSESAAGSTERLSISFILNATQVESLADSLDEYRNQKQSFVWRRDLTAGNARIFITEARKAKGMESPGFAVAEARQDE